MMPMRHVPYSNTLVAHSGPFATAALPAFRAAWAEYARCKHDAACRRTLCGVQHIADPRWLDSPLAHEYATRPLAAQWHVPAAPALATTPDEQPRADAGSGSGRAADGRSVDVDGWRAAREECVRVHGQDEGKVTVCARTKWGRKVKAALSLKERIAIAAAANSSGGAEVAGLGHQGGGAARRGMAAAAKKGTAAAGPVGGSEAQAWPTTSIVRDGVTYVAWARSR